jgi:hypothetical protein
VASWLIDERPGDWAWWCYCGSFGRLFFASSLFSATSIHVRLVTLPVVSSGEVADWAAGSGSEVPPVA